MSNWESDNVFWQTCCNRQGKDTGDSLYRSSSLRRRRDASPVTRTAESVGQEGVGVVPERPSLFSTSGSSSFNPFSAALSSLWLTLADRAV